MNNRSGDLWDANSEWWFANISENNFQEYSEIILPLSIQLLAEKKLILDLGTGTGAIAKQISKDPSQTVIGLDISLKQLLGASRKNPGPLYLQSDSDNLPFKKGIFDGVLSSMVLEHIENLEDTACEIARVIQPHGRWVVIMNHPVFQTPGSGPVEKKDEKQTGILWQIADYLNETSDIEEIAEGIRIPYEHRTLSQYFNTFIQNGFIFTSVLEPALRSDWQGESWQYKKAIPRLLVLVLEKKPFQQTRDR